MHSRIRAPARAARRLAALGSGHPWLPANRPFPGRISVCVRAVVTPATPGWAAGRGSATPRGTTKYEQWSSLCCPFCGRPCSLPASRRRRAGQAASRSCCLCACQPQPARCGPPRGALARPGIRQAGAWMAKELAEAEWKGSQR